VAIGAEPKPERDFAFQIAIESKSTWLVGDKITEFESESEINYTWHHSKSERQLTLTSTTTTNKSAGKVVGRVSMSRSTFEVLENGKTSKFDMEHAPAAIRKISASMFGGPLFRIQAGSDGEAEKSEFLGDAQARDRMNRSGILDNVLLMHPPHSTDRMEWTAERQVTFGSDRFLKGLLNYRKGNEANGRTTVKVSGNLDTVVQPETADMQVKEARNIVKGNLAYDPNEGEWVGGNLRIEMTAEVKSAGGITGSLKGLMVCRLERINEKKEAKPEDR
jgi:hypothetical protein